MTSNLSPDLLNALNDCINRLNRGETLSDCLRAHPRQTAQLLPLLEVLIATRPLLVVPLSEVREAQDRVRFRIAEALAEPITPPMNTGMRPVLTAILVLLLVIAVVTFTLSQWMPTPSAPMTATATPSPTSTITPTATATPSPTSTTTPTATATPSPTSTTTPTATATPSPTSTITPTATATPTATSTITPTAAPATATPAGCVVNPPTDWVRYQVRSGDTLSGLAVATDTTLENLITINCLQNPRFLVVGQVLYLPRLPVRPGQPVQIDQPPGDGGVVMPTPGQAEPTPIPGNPGNNDDDDD